MVPVIIAVISLFAANKKRQSENANRVAVQQQALVAPAAWYPCPWDSTMLRWWDGYQWTAHTAYLNTSMQYVTQ